MAYIWKSHNNIVWSVLSSHLYMGSWYRIQLARLYLPTEPSHQPKFSFRVSLVLLSVPGKHLTFARQSHIIHQHQLLVTEKGFTDSLGLSTSIILSPMSKNKFISYLASYIHLFSRPYFYLHVCTCVCMLVCTYGYGCLWKPEEDVRSLRAADCEPLSVGPGNWTMFLCKDC